MPLTCVAPLTVSSPDATTRLPTSSVTPSARTPAALTEPSTDERPSRRTPVRIANVPADAPGVWPVAPKLAVPPSPTVSSSTPVSVPPSVSVTPATLSCAGATSSPPDATLTSIDDSTVEPPR